MTSTGKLIAGTMIIAASVMTAKYLHQQPAAEIDNRPATQAPAPRLKWQIRESANHGQTSLQPMEQGQFVNPTSFAQLASAQVDDAQTALGSVAPPEMQLPSIGSAPGDARRQAIPFAVSSEPVSPLMMVDDEELDPASRVGDYVPHTVQFGETLPDIALQYFGQREAYMAIYQANLDVLTNPAAIEPGIVLKIPAH